MSKNKPRFFERVMTEVARQQDAEAATSTKPLAERVARPAVRPVPAFAGAAPAVPDDVAATNDEGPTGFAASFLAQNNQSLANRVETAERERDTIVAELAALKRSMGDALLELDPSRVAPSPFARRLPQAYTDEKFRSLCDDIKRIGGNIQPITVRRYTGSETGQYDYEVVVGHRRRAACASAQLMVIAMVKDVDNEEVARLMASENDNREPESRLELGLHYQKLLADGVARSERHLSELVRSSRSTVQRCLRMVEIAPAILAAFDDPREVRVEWTEHLIDIWKRDQEGVEARIVTLNERKSRRSALATYHAITNASSSFRVRPQTLRLNDQPVMKIVASPGGESSIKFTKHAPQELIDAVIEAARQWHRSATDDNEVES